MLLAGILAAALGACPDGYVSRQFPSRALDIWGSEYCENELDPNSYLGGTDPYNCDVAHDYRCCGKDETDGLSYTCFDLDQNECLGYHWCAPDATSNTALEPAAIAAIAATPVLIIAAAAGVAL